MCSESGEEGVALTEAPIEGKKEVTVAMVKKWVKAIEKVCSYAFSVHNGVKGGAEVSGSIVNQKGKTAVITCGVALTLSIIVIDKSLYVVCP